MKKLILILATVAIAFGMQAKPRSIEAHHGKVAGGYNFWLATPEDTSTPKPLIIFLHGASLCGNNLDKVRRYGTIDALERGREIDAYVVAPQNPGGGWRPSKVKDVMEWVKANGNVDTSRIYVLGMSLGGYGTIDFAATYPDEIAAAIGICGGGSVKGMANLNKMPMWIVHGTADRAVTVAQSDKVVSAMREADSKTPRLIYDRVPGMNHSQPARMFYMPEIYEWLFKHSLTDKGRPVHKAIPISVSAMSDAYKGISRKPGGHHKSKASKSHKHGKKHGAKSSRKRGKRSHR